MGVYIILDPPDELPAKPPPPCGGLGDPRGARCGGVYGGRGALIKKSIAYNKRCGQNSAQLDVESISAKQRVYQKLQRQQESPAANGSKESTPQGAGSSNQHAASNRLHAVRGSKHKAAGSTQ